jgi:cysteine synthase B
LAFNPIANNVRLFGKAEWFNPSGSVKDRSVYSILKTAEANGSLAGKTILDSTSGNAGIAYATLGSSLGHRVTLTLPKSVNDERKRLLRAYGVELIYTDPLEGSDGAIRKARELYAKNPERFFYADQYSNDANWRAHYETTGVEIWEQTHGAVTHLVAGVGTGGTIMGAGRRLKQFNPDIKVIAVQPDSPFHGLEGLKDLETSMKPRIYDANFPDKTVKIPTESAQRVVRKLAREGVLIGPSAGAAIVASEIVAKEVDEATIVAILPDGGERYLSERFWEEQ